MQPSAKNDAVMSKASHVPAASAAPASIMPTLKFGSAAMEKSSTLPAPITSWTRPQIDSPSKSSQSTVTVDSPLLPSFNSQQVYLTGSQFRFGIGDRFYDLGDGNPVAGASPTQIENAALTRYTSETLSANGTPVPGGTFTTILAADLELSIDWRVEHAVNIDTELSDTGATEVTPGVWEPDPVTGLGLTSTAAGDPSPEVKGAALDALVEMRHAEIVPWLLRLVRGKDPEIVWDESDFYESGWDDWTDIQTKSIVALNEVTVIEVRRTARGRTMAALFGVTVLLAFGIFAQSFGDNFLGDDFLGGWLN